MPAPLPLPAAARALGLTPSTVRRWLAAGAPAVRPGRRGPGNGATVDVEQLRAWRASSGGQEHDGDELGDWRAHVERELQAFFALPELDGKPAWRLFELDERQAAAVVVWLASRILGPDLSPEFQKTRARITGFR